MPPSFTKIRELEPTQVEWAIMVRVVRCYSLHVGDDPKKIYAMECVFHDEKGGRIHATIKKPLIPRFCNMFREEHIYTIKNFVVTENGKKMRTTTAPYRLIFIGRTVVTEVLGTQFPRNMYNFQKYDVLGAIHEDQLVDVIGRLSSHGTRQNREVQGRETSMLDITLENLEGAILPCTIWGLYAEELDGFIEATEGCIVIIMQLCKIMRFRGEVSLYNTFHVSKVIFDQVGREIEEFRNSLILAGRMGTPVRNVSVSSATTLEEELELSRDRIITLDQLIKMHTIGDYWCYCKIVAIEPMSQWFYVSRKKYIWKMTAAGCTFFIAPNVTV